MFEPVSTKLANYVNLASGVYGNRLRNWRNLDEYAAAGYSGSVVIRYLTPQSPYCTYGVTPEMLDETIAGLVADGADPKKLTFNEQMPDHLIVIQGELEADRDWTLYYSTLRDHMRVALNTESAHVYGPKTWALLRSKLTASSFEDLMALVDVWPKHVIEFSAFEQCIGDIPGRNAVVWEVRLY